MVIVCKAVQIKPFRMHDLLFWKNGIIDSYLSLCAYKCLPILFQTYRNRIRSCFHFFCDLDVDPEASPFLRIDIRLIVLSPSEDRYTPESVLR